MSQSLEAPLQKAKLEALQSLFHSYESRDKRPCSIIEPEGTASGKLLSLDWFWHVANQWAMTIFWFWFLLVRKSNTAKDSPHSNMCVLHVIVALCEKVARTAKFSVIRSDCCSCEFGSEPRPCWTLRAKQRMTSHDIRFSDPLTLVEDLNPASVVFTHRALRHVVTGLRFSRKWEQIYFRKKQI